MLLYRFHVFLSIETALPTTEEQRFFTTKKETTQPDLQTEIMTSSPVSPTGNILVIGGILSNYFRYQERQYYLDQRSQHDS